MRSIAIALALCGCGAAGPTPAEPERVPPAIAAPIAPDDTQVHGSLELVQGQPVLRVWGTPRQMGFAHGALLRARIIDVVEHYALDVVPPRTLDATASLVGSVAAIPATLREEAEGIVAGMQHAGGARIPALRRDLTVEDLFVLNAMTDLLAVGCSSVSAWGEATVGELAGQPAIVRNLDWSADAELLANQIVIVTMPADPSRRAVVSVAFAGYIGCLSCVNDAGVAALFNMGYGDGAAGLAGAVAGFSPANLLLRDVLERSDVDGDEAFTGADVEAALRASTQVGSWILHVVEPGAVAAARKRAPARILEVESDGVVRREPGEPALGPDLLAATNHLRAKAEPRECSRYDRIEARAKSSQRRFDRDALWDLAIDLRLAEVVHTMLVEPDSRRIALWLRQPGERAKSPALPVVHEWATLVTGTRSAPTSGTGP
ncbi:MAG TPA: C45 family peptidase [Nannocystaceae bacterium]|nr:C45 family peptidase [Nannocystaceae bacterium]